MAILPPLVLTRLNGNGMLNLTITSAAAGETRTYATAAQIAADVADARVWSGIHFRTADAVSGGRLSPALYVSAHTE